MRRAHSQHSTARSPDGMPQPVIQSQETMTKNGKYPLQCFINQYFLVSNDGAIGVFANYAIVRSCSEMQVLDFRNNRSTRKRNSTTSRTFPVFSPQQVLWQPKTTIKAHISYWYSENLVRVHPSLSRDTMANSLELGEWPSQSGETP